MDTPTRPGPDLADAVAGVSRKKDNDFAGGPPSAGAQGSGLPTKTV